MKVLGKRGEIGVVMALVVVVLVGRWWWEGGEEGVGGGVWVLGKLPCSSLLSLKLSSPVYQRRWRVAPAVKSLASMHLP